MRTEVPLLQAQALTAKYGGRTLFCQLNFSLGRERVALVGRNGVGKSTLLDLLSQRTQPSQGQVIHRGRVAMVAQQLLPGSDSPGRERRNLLHEARFGGADLLLLDEPTQDLDAEAVAWLKGWISTWQGGLLVATHDRNLLQDFRHFFVMAESGCRYISSTLQNLEEELERTFATEQERYLRRINRLKQQEEQQWIFARRRQRKEQYGRTSELDRATPRILLNAKRGQAQVSHGRINKQREERLAGVRDWAKSARRALKVELPLDLTVPVSLPESTEPVVQTCSVSAVRGGRLLVEGLNLSLARQRLAVVGPNGAGKTTLLQILAGVRQPDSGSVRVAHQRLGVIEQGGANWKLEESLADILERHLESKEIGERLVAQRFPLALAQRPLRTLSPGERVRAALLALLSRQPFVELLILDEPSYSLDILGQKALREVLASWPGGLVVASHDAELLKALRLDATVTLGASFSEVGGPSIPELEPAAPGDTARCRSAPCGGKEG